MKTILIKKPNIKLLKSQCETLTKIVYPQKDEGSDYISPDEIKELGGLICLLENIADVADGFEPVFKSSEQARMGNVIATIFDLDENEKGRFNTHMSGDFTPLGLYRLCKRVVTGETVV